MISPGPILFYLRPLPSRTKLQIYHFIYRKGISMCLKNVGFPGGSDDKETACNAGDRVSTPGSGRCPGEGNGNPMQYSCLENSMGRGAWWGYSSWVAKRHNWTTNTFYNFFSKNLGLFSPPAPFFRRWGGGLFRRVLFPPKIFLGGRPLGKWNLPGIEPRPLHLKLGVRATRPPGKSPWF